MLLNPEIQLDHTSWPMQNVKPLQKRKISVIRQHEASVLSFSALFFNSQYIYTYINRCSWQMLDKNDFMKKKNISCWKWWLHTFISPTENINCTAQWILWTCVKCYWRKSPSLYLKTIQEEIISRKWDRTAAREGRGGHQLTIMTISFSWPAVGCVPAPLTKSHIFVTASLS